MPWEYHSFHCGPHQNVSQLAERRDCLLAFKNTESMRGILAEREHTYAVITECLEMEWQQERG